MDVERGVLRPPLAVDRRARLLAALREQGTVRVSDLVRELGVAPVTVRRDISELAANGLVRRVHGGAVLLDPDRPPPATGPAGDTGMPGGVQDDSRATGASADGHRGTTTGASSAAQVGAIGLLVPSLDYYWPGVVRGAEEEARARGLRTVLRGSSYDVQNERLQLARLVEGPGVDAVIAAPTTASPHFGETVAWLAGCGLPVVLVERTASIPPHGAVMESVVSDHALGAAMAVRHLLALGHRSVGLVMSAVSPTGPHLRRGWRDALEEAGMDPGRMVHEELEGPRAAGAFDELLDRVLASGTTSLLVHADGYAIAVVQRCEERGIRVPEDLSVVAYDDELAGLFSPALTAVRPPRRSIGRASVELVVRRCEDPARPVHRVVVSPTLHVRDSTAQPPA